MAQVPIYDDFRVKLDPLRPVMQKTPDVSTGLQALAKGMGDVADSWDRIEYRQAQSDAFKAQADIGEQWAKTDIELRNKYRGDNAQAYAEESAKWWKEKQDTLSASLSPRARALASKGLGQMRLSATTNGLTYVEREKENAAEVNYNTAQSVITNQAGTTLPLDAAIKQITDNAVNRFAVLGFGEAAAKEHARKHVTDAIANNVTRQLDNPTVARATLEKYRDQMDGDAYTRLNDAVKTSETRAAGIAAGEAIFTGVLNPSQGGSGARGIRNNNPGNIVKSSIRWEGQVDGQESRFVSFATPQAGIAALGKNLLAYQSKHGLDTVEGIIGRWAPASENNTAAYVSRVAKEMGVAPNTKLNLRDQATLQGLTAAIIRHENGGNPYGADVVAAGVSAALGKTKLPAGPSTSRAPISGTDNKFWAQAREGGEGAATPTAMPPKTLGTALAEADNIPDPERREIAKRVIREKFALRDIQEKETYAADLQAAQDIAFKGVGGWRNVPADLMSRLKPADKANIIEGPPKESDPDTMLALQNKPELWNIKALQERRALLAESDYRAFYSKFAALASKGKIKIDEVTVDNDQYKDVLTKAGMYYLMTSDNKENKQEMINLRALYER